MILENLITQTDMIVPHIQQNTIDTNDLLLEISEWDKAVCKELSTTKQEERPMEKSEIKILLHTNPEKLISYINTRNQQLLNMRSLNTAL